MTVVACATQVFDRYCLESLNPAFAHVWVMVIEATAVTIAMYCLIQFYIQIKDDIAQHKPLLKVLAIKLVIFLSFWQTIGISLLTSTGAIKANDKFQTPDIKIGIPAMLLCIEMAIFSVFHLFAFSWKPYTLTSKERLADAIPGESAPTYRGGFLGIKAIIDSMNPWDMVKAVGRAARWLFRGRKHRHHDVSYDLSRAPSDNPASKPPLFAPPTARTGARPLHYGGDGTGEGEILLANPQAMGLSGPGAFRTETSPYRTETRTDYNMSESDIGVATSSNNDRPYRYPQPHLGQQSGVTAAPYPNESRGRQQAHMPYARPPGEVNRDDNMF
jgi:Organic solute transporter Ostalpha